MHNQRVTSRFRPCPHRLNGFLLNGLKSVTFCISLFMYYVDESAGGRLLAAPIIIAELVERFDRYQDTYKSHQYNEAQVRQEFVDPFFKALGWDLDNAQGFAEAYKEVIHEDTIKVGHSTKAPDYSFRVGEAASFSSKQKSPPSTLQTTRPRPFSYAHMLGMLSYLYPS